MEFKETFDFYNKYKSKEYVYSSDEITVKTDWQIRNELDLFDYLFNDNFCKEVGIDKCNDIKRFDDLITLQRVFDNELQNYLKERKYFYACSFSVYKDTYDERLKSFLSEFEDAEELDFLNDELLNIEESEHTQYDETRYENLPVFLPDNYYVNKNYSFKKRKDFLERKIEELKSDEEISIVNRRKVKWHGTQVELIELINALIVTEVIKPPKGQKGQTIIGICDFFDVTLGKEHSKIFQDIMNKEVGNETTFLNKLRENLLKYIADRIEQRRNLR